MGLVVRLSPGTEPVLEIHAADLSELDASLRGMRSQGVWSALKGAAREFADAPLATAEAVIEELLPGATVIADSGGDPPFVPDPPVDLAAEAAQVRKWNELARERAIKRGDIEPPSEPADDYVINAAPAYTGPANTAPLAF